MNTKSKTIAQMAATLADSPQMEQEVQEEIQKSSMVSYLLSLRTSKGLTQEKVAESMGCDPSKISRLESGNDESLKWNDIVAYARALNLSLDVVVEDPSLPAAEQIKHCVYTIYGHLKNLADLARRVGGDDKIAKKIHEFSGEVLFNFLLCYKDHHDDLRSFIKLTPPSQPALTSSEPSLVARQSVGATEKVNA